MNGSQPPPPAAAQPQQQNGVHPAWSPTTAGPPADQVATAPTAWPREAPADVVPQHAAPHGVARTSPFLSAQQAARQAASQQAAQQPPAQQPPAPYPGQQHAPYQGQQPPAPYQSQPSAPQQPVFQPSAPDQVVPQRSAPEVATVVSPPSGPAVPPDATQPAADSQPVPPPQRPRTVRWWEKLVPSVRRRVEQEIASEATAARAVAEQAERDRREHVLRVIDTEVDHHRITVSSLKGGVTKTTTVLGLGTALAMHRRSAVTAVDGNPHRGTLAERLGEEHAKTVRDLIDNADQIRTSSQFRQFTNVARSRLEVIAAHKDPRKAQVFTAEEYRLVTDIITRFRPLLITDTGTDLLTPLMEAVYQSTDTLIVPATTAEDGWKLAAETLDWWEKTPDGQDLVRNAIVPVTVIDTFTLPDPTHLPDEATLGAQLAAFNTEQQRQIAMVVDRIGPRVAKIVLIPHDSKLKRGNLFEWDMLQQSTRDAYLELAYEVTSRFPGATPTPAAPERAMPARAW